MSKRVSPKTAPDKDLPKLPETRAEKKNLKANESFNHASAPLADTQAPEITSFHASAMTLLIKLLRIAACGTLGNSIHHADCDYDYIGDENCHVFKMQPKSVLPGRRKMPPGMHAALRMDVRKKIETFLYDFSLHFDDEKGRIFPEFGEIFFDDKRTLFKALESYITNGSGERIDIQSGSIPARDVPQEFGQVNFEPAQAEREYQSYVVAKVFEVGRIHPGLLDELLAHSPVKPYAGRADYYALAAASRQTVDKGAFRLSTLIELTKQQIDHEDGAQNYLDENYEIARHYLTLSIN